jgi:hypothetical protein
MGANDGAVDEHLFEIRILGQLSEYTMPDLSLRPPGKALIDTVPRSEIWWQITPRTSGSGNPQNGFNEQAVIGRRTARIARLAWQQCGYPLKLVVTQPHPYHPDSAPKVRI